jgi:hypothetical protein
MDGHKTKEAPSVRAAEVRARDRLSSVNASGILYFFTYKDDCKYLFSEGRLLKLFREMVHPPESALTHRLSESSLTPETCYVRLGRYLTCHLISSYVGRSKTMVASKVGDGMSRRQGRTPSRVTITRLVKDKRPGIKPKQSIPRVRILSRLVERCASRMRVEWIWRDSEMVLLCLAFPATPFIVKSVALLA